MIATPNSPQAMPKQPAPVPRPRAGGLGMVLVLLGVAVVLLYSMALVLSSPIIRGAEVQHNQT